MKAGMEVIQGEDLYVVGGEKTVVDLTNYM